MREQQTMNSEAEEFLHKHTLFISIAVPSSETVKEQCNLHYLHHHNPTTVFTISTTLTLDDLRHVNEFRELGTFPIPSNQSPAENEPASPSSSSVIENRESQQNLNIDKAIIQQLISNLRTTMSAEQESARVKLYSIEVLTRVEDAFANGNVDEMVWKWTKPSSPYLRYRPMGWWYSTIEEAVTDWVWTAGTGIQLLMEAVGKEKKEFMLEGGKKPLIIPVWEERPKGRPKGKQTFES